MINFVEQWKIVGEAQNSVPVDVEALPERFGIQYKKAFLPKNISGMLERVGESFLITVSASDPHTRQRFTLAHELGHYLLHRKLIGEGVDDDRAYRSTEGGKYHNTLIGPREETQANRFAANLLMPRLLINQEWSRRGNDKSQKTIREMASLFIVSNQTMAISLGLAA